MRKITIVGVDNDSKVVECEIAGSGERLELPLDETLRSAAKGEFGETSSTNSEDADAEGAKDAVNDKDAANDTVNDKDAASDEKDSAASGSDSASDADSSSSTTATPSLTSLATPWDDAAGADSDSSSAPQKAGDTDSRTGGMTGDKASAKNGEPSVPRTPLRPKEIQNRVRAGASIDEICELTGMPYTRVEAFAYPILQERGDRAERARKAHPMLADGPAVDSIEKLTLESVEERGVAPELVKWDSWRIKNGNWVVQATWPAGLSDDASAAWEFVPDSHGGVGHPLDDEALAIGDPSLRRQMSSVPYEPFDTDAGYTTATGYTMPTQPAAHQAADQRWGRQDNPAPAAGPNIRPAALPGAQQPYQPPGRQQAPQNQQPFAQPGAQRFTGQTRTGQDGADIPAVPPAQPSAGDRSPFAMDARRRQGQQAQQGQQAPRGQQGSVPTDPTRRPLGGPIELGPDAGHPRGPRTHAPAAGDAAWQQGAGRGDSAPHFGDAAPGASAQNAQDSAAAQGNDAAGGHANDDEFLMHPPSSDAPQHKAKGKHPTMPSWEDVLLGVRSPKDNS
ncbi:septation protein SepH [Dietzia sp.]|uniref:septation protein SepH n=1 Tax=Dietzia sp. TaxID=1871616 RepID=UPI002FD8A030